MTLQEVKALRIGLLEIVINLMDEEEALKNLKEKYGLGNYLKINDKELLYLELKMNKSDTKEKHPFIIECKVSDVSDT